MLCTNILHEVPFFQRAGGLILPSYQQRMYRAYTNQNKILPKTDHQILLKYVKSFRGVKAGRSNDVCVIRSSCERTIISGDVDMRTFTRGRGIDLPYCSIGKVSTFLSLSSLAKQPFLSHRRSQMILSDLSLGIRPPGFHFFRFRSNILIFFTV